MFVVWRLDVSRVRRATRASSESTECLAEVAWNCIGQSPRIAMINAGPGLDAYHLECGLEFSPVQSFCEHVALVVLSVRFEELNKGIGRRFI